jgi:hypothetical protein
VGWIDEHFPATKQSGHSREHRSRG